MTLRVGYRSDAVDLRAGVSRDALRILDEAHGGQRDDLVVERDREALELGVVGDARREQVLPPLGLALGGARERLAARAREVEGDDRLRGLRVRRLLGVLDVRAGQL